MKKSKKLLIYGLTLGVLGVCLTGCTIKLDDDEVGKLQDTIKSVKIESDDTEESKVIEYEKIELDENSTITNSTKEEKNVEDNDENSAITNSTKEEKNVEDNKVAFIDSSIVQEEFYGYLNVFGYNQDGAIVWKYSTKRSPLTEWGCDSEYIGAEYGGVYIIDNGKLAVLGADNGELLCESKESVEAGRKFVLAGDNEVFEAVFIYSSVSNTLYEFDTSDGRLVKELNLDGKINMDYDYIYEMRYDTKNVYDSKMCLILTAYAGEGDIAWEAYIDVDDFSYTVEENK